MSIPLHLLNSTLGRALGFVVYGGNGTRKTFGIHTCPPLILCDDFEGGTTSFTPWIRRYRAYNSDVWIEYSQADREAAFHSITPENLEFIKKYTRINPAPYIDVTWYDNMDPLAYQIWIKNLAEFPTDRYSTYACDSLQEQTGLIKTLAKGLGKELDPMATQLWGEVQDRSVAALRYMRNLRNKGIFVYATCSETIDKDYVNDPRTLTAEQRKRGAQPEQPYSVKGTVNVSGQVVGAVQHMCDCMFHSRAMGVQGIRWVRDPEPIGAGGAFWEAKDRTGRIKEQFLVPNIRMILNDIYGEDVRKAIYAAGLNH